MPNPKARQFSISKIKDFEACPYQFYRKHLHMPKLPFIETASTKWGSAVHTLYEIRLTHGARMGHQWNPAMAEELAALAAPKLAKDKKISNVEALRLLGEVLQVWEARYEKWAQLVFSLGGDIRVEVQNAISKDVMLDAKGKYMFKPTKWFAKPERGDLPVWFRAIGDAMVVLPPTPEGITRGVLFDWKTGKLYDKRGNDKHDPAQSAITAMVSFSHWLELDVIDTMFVYTDEPNGAEHRRDRYHRGDLVNMLEPVRASMKGIIECDDRDSWPKTTSGLCGGWCPVQDCEHWEDRR